MKIIDAHVHYSKIRSFHECAEHTSVVNYSRQGYVNEASSYEVVKSVCMGLTEMSPGSFPDTKSGTPMTADLDEALPAGMYLCLGINPNTLTDSSLLETENMIKSNACIVGIKIYAGYYHVDITDPVYTPVYNLAKKHDITVVIHTGETYSDRGLLKYSHPLRVDDLAVSHPEMRIVACHMGVPWVFDACEVAAKNPNVFLDLSGMLVGSDGYITRQTANPLLLDRYRQALTFLDNYSKILYGTDWPLAPMGAYIDFCKALIPEEAYEKVFYENAERVYKL